LSVFVIAEVWKVSLPPAPCSWGDKMLSPSTQKIVLVALADTADPDGTGIRPGVARLVWMTQLCERTVRDVLRSFRDRGILIQVRPGRAQYPAEYRLAPWVFGGATVAPVKKARGATVAPLTGNSCTSRGATVAPYPSLPVQTQGSDDVEEAKTAPPVSAAEAQRQIAKLKKAIARKDEPAAPSRPSTKRPPTKKTETKPTAKTKARAKSRSSS
jgi:hypothetical protein